VVDKDAYWAQVVRYIHLILQRQDSFGSLRSMRGTVIDFICGQRKLRSGSGLKR
jgi:hypothetical protein